MDTVNSRKHSEETKRKMSEAALGKTLSQETRDRVSIANGGGTHVAVMSEPGWLRTCASDSFLLAKDIFTMFGFDNSTQLQSHVNSGRFPKPSIRTQSISKGRPHGVLTWTVREIRAELHRRQELQRAGEINVSARPGPGGESYLGRLRDMPEPMQLHASYFKGKPK